MVLTVIVRGDTNSPMENERKVFIPSTDNRLIAPEHDLWPPHHRIERVKMHPRIEFVENGTPVTVVLWAPVFNRRETLCGWRDGPVIRLGEASSLYPGLTCTPYDPFAVFKLDRGVNVNDVA